MSAPAKHDLRAQLLAERRSLGTAQLQAASEAIAARILALPEVRAARTLALYQALKHEIEMAPLWRGLHGKRVLFPRVHHGTRILAFAPVDDPAELVVGAYGIREPPGADVPLEEIELIVVPGLGFDAGGGRLGRGGGYYDATLAAAPHALRVAPALRLLEAVPAEVHDEPVDVIVTPTDTVHAPRRSGR